MHRVLALLMIAIMPAPLFADEPIKPEDNRPDEPRIKAYSLDRAVAFVDAAALEWTRKRECFSCHTNFSFLYARPTITAQAPAHAEVRAALETMVTVRWPELKPRFDAEVIASAAALAHNDAHTTKRSLAPRGPPLAGLWRLHPPTAGCDGFKCACP